MKHFLLLVAIALAGSLNAQTANDAKFWTVTKTGNDATYFLKLIDKLNVYGMKVKVKRDATATKHYLELSLEGVRTTASIFKDGGLENGYKSEKLQTIDFYEEDYSRPYFDISKLTAGNYVIHIFNANKGGVINLIIE